MGVRHERELRNGFARRTTARTCAVDSFTLRLFFLMVLFYCISRRSFRCISTKKPPIRWFFVWSCYRDSKPKRAKQPKNGIKHAVTPVKTERTATSWNDVPPSEASYAARRDGIREREREQTPKARPLARQPAYPLVNSLT